MMEKPEKLIETDADLAILECLNKVQSFSMVAGAGSGKTTSLVEALKYLRSSAAPELRRDDRKIACLTYTNRAVAVISERLNFDELYHVSTLHTFLWDAINRYTRNIKIALVEDLIPKKIEKKQEEDNGGQSQRAIAARAKIVTLREDLERVPFVQKFEYNDTNFSDYSNGKLNHDDVISVSSYLIIKYEILRRVLWQRYPYILVDEAQDTFSDVVEALNKLCEGDGHPIVGYFGDPMQQIYDKRAGEFTGPPGSAIITKTENFRSAKSVIKLLNAFRTDVEQYAAGRNAEIEGSVFVRLVQAEEPELPRRRYSDDQLLRASQRYDEAIGEWGWDAKDDVKSLFLVRQMIARRLGFPGLQKLFTGPFASTNAQDEYEAGKHFLLRPFVESLYRLFRAHSDEDLRTLVDILVKHSPAFDPEGTNSNQSIGHMTNLANEYATSLADMWNNGTLGEILKYCRENRLCKISEKLSLHLDREPRLEDYDAAENGLEKGEWLADAFFQQRTAEIGAFVDFIDENTPFSTQHGVKGEEYKNVVVVFDDVEAAWHSYSFSKILTPETAGQPTEGQSSRSKKLAYVCFSRAEENLRILLFTQNVESAKKELIECGLFCEDQIQVA